MRRLLAAAFPLALLIAIVVSIAISVEDSAADLESSVFTSRPQRLRLIIPRGWRATDQPSYPGLLLWMMRSQPQGQMVLTAETFTRELYCSWDASCRTGHDSVPTKYACELRRKLQAQRMRVGPLQAGPKDNEASGLPSVWFEYDDGAHFLRQAIAVSSELAISLVLSAPTNEARAAHARSFEQALRTLHLLTREEVGATATSSGSDAAITLNVAASDAAASGPGDAGIQTPVDAAVVDAGARFESAPAPNINPVGPCPK